MINNKLKKYIIFTTVFLLLLQGCVPMLQNERSLDTKDIVVPKHFNNATGDKGKISSKNIIQENRKLLFDDRNLNELINIAIKNNQELHILDQEISIAKNDVMARRGEYWPTIGFNGGYEFEKVGEHTSQGASDDIASVDKRLQNRRVGLVSSWEIDIWKKLRNAAQSAYFEYLASSEAKNFAITNLVAEISTIYYELVALDNQNEVINKYISTLETALEVVELLKRSGRTTSLAIKRFSAEVSKSKAQKYELQQKIIATENKLNMLLGRFPKPIKRSKYQISNKPSIKLYSGVPTYLIDNRPDIKEAKLQLEAAKLNVESVKARFYPALNIEAALGFESFNSSHFFQTPESVFYNLALGITAPLINRAAIKADYFSANNLQIKAIYNYEMTLIKSVAEVSSQLSNIQNLNKIYSFKLEQVKTMEESVEVANMLFKSARVDYLEPLLAQRDLLEVKNELIESKKELFTSQIALYKSLGGGWQIK